MTACLWYFCVEVGAVLLQEMDCKQWVGQEQGLATRTDKPGEDTPCQYPEHHTGLTTAKHSPHRNMA